MPPLNVFLIPPSQVAKTKPVNDASECLSRREGNQERESICDRRGKIFWVNTCYNKKWNVAPMSSCCLKPVNMKLSWYHGQAPH